MQQSDKIILFTVSQLIALSEKSYKCWGTLLSISENSVFKKVNGKSHWKATEIAIILKVINDQFGWELDLKNIIL